MVGNEEQLQNAFLRISELETRLQEYAQQIEKLSVDNNSLREQLFNVEARNSGMDLNPPKMRKKNMQAAGTSNATGTVQANGSRANLSNTSQNEDMNMDGVDNMNTTNAGGFTVVANKKKKIIQARDTDLKVVRNCIKNAQCKNFTLKQTNLTSPIKISVENADEIPAVRSALQQSKISYHEFKWDSEKNKCFIIRGLSGVVENDLPDIMAELVASHIPADAKLSIFSTGYMRARNIKSSLLKLVLPPNFDTQILRNIKYIDHVAVRFETMKSKAVVQCKNCQRFGHSASGCQHSHRCVKCGANHLRDNCPRTNNKAIKLVCCNCKGDHSANNLSQCKFFQETYVKSKSPVAANNIPAPSNNNNSFAKINNQTFADVAAIGNSSSSHHSSSSLANLSKKIDMILKMVSKHEAILQNSMCHG